MSQHTNVETLRQAVAELAEETRLKVVDRLDDPNERCLKIEEGSHRSATVQPGDTQRYCHLTIEVEDGSLDDAIHRQHIDQLKTELRQRLRALRSYRA